LLNVLPLLRIEMRPFTVQVVLVLLVMEMLEMVINTRRLALLDRLSNRVIESPEQKGSVLGGGASGGDGRLLRLTRRICSKPAPWASVLSTRML
jgi:hypothetical protein